MPGTSPPTPNVINLVMYSADAQQGRLFMVTRDKDGHLQVVINRYDLTRKGDSWIADEGNGGLATFRAIARYVEKLTEVPAERLTANGDPSACKAG